MSVLTRTAVAVPAGEVVLKGELVLPEDARGIVVFAHGSGSSRHSPRNARVASTLHGARLGTLLLDLLTEDEEQVDRRTAALRFDIDLLARRVLAAVDWLRRHAPDASLGAFGASTGAAAALVAAAARPDDVAAVVSRGGRPDLAGPVLRHVRAPTLLVVGGADLEVLELNRRALAALGAQEKELVVVAGAGHLFEEPGALDEVARLATDWFARWLGAR